MRHPRKMCSTILPALLLVMALGACGKSEQSAQEAYERLVFHARTGNELAFLNGFTPQSQRLIRALLSLRRTYGDLVDADADPYRALILDVVDSVTVEERTVTNTENESVEVSVATLTVTNGDYKRQIQMIETEEGWKLDALELQAFWAEDGTRRLTR